MINIIQKDKKGNVLVDNTTKDSEIIKLTKDPKEYFEEEDFDDKKFEIYKNCFGLFSVDFGQNLVPFPPAIIKAQLTSSIVLS